MDVSVADLGVEKAGGGGGGVGGGGGSLDAAAPTMDEAGASVGG